MHHTCTSTFQRGQSVPGTNRSNVKVLSAGTIGGGHLCSSRHTIRAHGCPCRPVRAYYLRSGVLVGPCLTANTRTVNAGCLSLDSRATKRGLQILDSTLLVPLSYPLVYLLVQDSPGARQPPKSSSRMGPGTSTWRIPPIASSPLVGSCRRFRISFVTHKPELAQ